MRVAYFSPLGPARTGIADYSEELLPYLARRAEIHLFVDGDLPVDHPLRAQFEVFDDREFSRRERRREYDVALYQMGNSIAHESIYRAASSYPGVLVLHDYVLHHLVAAMTVAHGDGASYIREMAYCHGLDGSRAARRAVRKAGGFPYDRYPLNRRLVDASLGVIVHSHYVKSLLAADSPEKPIAVLNHHVIPAPYPAGIDELRRSLGLNDTGILFASFGLATPEKRLDVALRAFRKVIERLPDSRFLIVGDALPGYDLKRYVHDLGLANHVKSLGYVAKEDLLKYVAATDVGMCLRWPSVGETSGSVLRLMNAGKPTVVSATGWYQEIPDDCCMKIPAGAQEGDRLSDCMLLLAESPQIRESIGKRAREHVWEHHHVENSALQYLSFVSRVIGQGALGGVNREMLTRD